MYQISYRFLVPERSAKPLVSAHDRIMGTHTSGPFKKRQPDELMFYVEIVKRLDALCKGKEADEGKTIPMIAADANLSYQTLYNILNGVSWCELPTIFKLERVLNAPLWHEGHLSLPFYTPSSVDD